MRSSIRKVPRYRQQDPNGRTFFQFQYIMEVICQILQFPKGPIRSQSFLGTRSGATATPEFPRCGEGRVSGEGDCQNFTTDCRGLEKGRLGKFGLTEEDLDEEARLDRIASNEQNTRRWRWSRIGMGKLTVSRKDGARRRLQQRIRVLDHRRRSIS